MPYYDYVCEKCELEFETKQGFNDEVLTDCPECGESSLRRLFNNPIIHVKEITTFGQQAEANAKREGKEKLQIMAEEAKARARAAKAGTKLPGGKAVERPEGLPWWRSGEYKGFPKETKPLDVSKIKNVEKFVVTGEKHGE